MDNIIQYFKLPQPDHHKIDVDSAELEILKGSRKKLKDNNFKLKFQSKNELVMNKTHNEIWVKDKMTKYLIFFNHKTIRHSLKASAISTPHSIPLNLAKVFNPCSDLGNGKSFSSPLYCDQASNFLSKNSLISI